MLSIWSKLHLKSLPYNKKSPDSCYGCPGMFFSVGTPCGGNLRGVSHPGSPSSNLCCNAFDLYYTTIRRIMSIAFSPFSRASSTSNTLSLQPAMQNTSSRFMLTGVEP